MTARKKLEEAQFFLTKLRSVPPVLIPGSPESDEFKYYVSACVWALYGSYDHLLYDYAQKYWPELGTDDFLDNKIFGLIAKATNNEEAKEFLEWYRTVQGRIDKDKDASTILKVRRIEAHRGTIDYSYLISLHDAVNASGAVTMGTYYSEPQDPTRTSQVPTPSVLVVAHFYDYPEKPVENVIENTLSLLKQIVFEAESKFG